MGLHRLLSLLKLFGIILLVNGDDNRTEVKENNSDLVTRIVGGYVGHRGQFPFQVLLDCFDLRDSIICGGSILNTHWILTAGHCVHKRTHLFVHLGAYKIFNVDHEQGRLKFKTTKWILHEKYVQAELQNDIALVQLPEDISYTSSIRPIRLKVKREQYSANDTFMMSGFGMDSFENPNTQRPIRFGVLNPLSQKECNKLMESLKVSNPTVICCKGKSGEIGGHGDSGGPVVLPKSKLQIGILSFINRPGGETMFVDVTAYIDWIEGKIGKTFMKEIE